MKKLLRILFLTTCYLLLATNYSFSQPYWNEWINFSGTQKYYKIPVAQNGVYRIDSLTLAHAGITNVDPHQFQLFFRGQEQYIYIKGEADGVFNASDYIEFYGQKNDGSLDSILYKGDFYIQPVRQSNPYYSLFSDTSAYFLTWNNATPHNRITLLSSDTTYSAFLPTNYFMKQETIENNVQYFYGRFTSSKVSFPQYEETEGWSGLDFGQCNCANTTYTATFNTSNIYHGIGTPNTTVTFALMGESDDETQSTGPAVLNHIINVQCIGFGGLNYSFSGYQLLDSAFSIPSVNIGSTTNTNVVFTSVTGNFSTSSNTVPYVTMKFPHGLDLENQDYYEMYVPSDNQPGNQSYFQFSDDTISSACLYDFTNHVRIPITKNGIYYKCLVPNSLSNAEKFCVVKSEYHFLTAPSIKPVGGTGYFVNYAALAVDSAFIIITNKSLMGDPSNGAIAYAQYRTSASGGGHKVLMADVDDLYDEFGYGIPKYPFSIRHFVDYCMDKFLTPPQNLFLIGKSIQPDLMRNTVSDLYGSNYASCLVPSIGYPTSDNMLVAGINNNSLYSPVPIGRLPVINTAEVNTYLNKVNEYEHQSPAEWMKQTIFISGGLRSSDQKMFAGYVKGYATIITDTSFGGDTSIFRKSSSSPTQTAYPDSTTGSINSGSFSYHLFRTLFSIRF